MNLDLRVLPVFGLIIILLIDLGCLLHSIPPVEAYGGYFQFLSLHFIFGLLSGIFIGQVVNEKNEER